MCIQGAGGANHSEMRLDAVLAHRCGLCAQLVAQQALQRGEVVLVLSDWKFQTLKSLAKASTTLFQAHWRCFEPLQASNRPPA